MVKHCKQAMVLKRNVWKGLTITALVLMIAVTLTSLLCNKSFGLTSNASQEKVVLVLFWHEGCPHCAKERAFLNKIKNQYPLQVKEFEISSRENGLLFQKVCKAYGFNPVGVPTTFIGDQYVVGFGSEQTTGEQIRSLIEHCLVSSCVNPLVKAGVETEPETQPGNNQNQSLTNNQSLKNQSNQVIVTNQSILVNGNTSLNNATSHGLQGNASTTVKIPIIGTVNTASVSIPLLTMIIGLVDGFNPCAMWVLTFLLTILVYARKRSKMLLVGLTFVITSGVIYFLFMTAWLNLFLYIGYAEALRIVIAIIGIVMGLINIKEFFAFKKFVTLTIPEKAKPKLFREMRFISHSTSLIVALLGTVTLAVTANFVELLCTAGFPAIYTKILTLRNLPTWKYYAYIALYNVFYVVPLLVIVIAFTLTLGAKKLSEKQGKVLKLVSGLLMLGLGLILLLKPELLVLG
ncbi:hypothetical protein J7L02_01360 [Candidatus Woesearchaeota archaeon]|nr:hypothetical protein [Candidatus Woesearchaeota archaeon]